MEDEFRVYYGLLLKTGKELGKIWDLLLNGFEDENGFVFVHFVV